jgi:lysophospholipase L1-like esterase
MVFISISKPFMRNILKVLFSFFCILFCFQNGANAQNSAIDFSKYDFIDLNKNIIHNDSLLNPFFNQLSNLKKGSKIKVNIIHLGDSHIQADFLTSEVRQCMQTEFGNGGRGMVMPFKVGRTNEPTNFATSSPNGWESKRCVFSDMPLPIGISGLTLQSNEIAPTISIKTYNYPPLNYDFNYVRVFQEKGPGYNNFTINDSLGYPLKIAIIDGGAFVTKIALPNLTNKITLTAVQDDFMPANSLLYGLSLENSNAGVLYHAIGINGAEYRHYNLALNFVTQTQYLTPDLIIISLGTNEAQASVEKFSPEEFTDNVNMLVRQLRRTNPNACFILTTPPDSFKRKKYRNVILPQIAKIIISCAKTNKCAYWDFYSLEGRANGAKIWKTNNLMQGDGVHFTRLGYQLQGGLLYTALYNSYIKRTNPKLAVEEEEITEVKSTSPMEPKCVPGKKTSIKKKKAVKKPAKKSKHKR